MAKELTVTLPIEVLEEAILCMSVWETELRLSAKRWRRKGESGREVLTMKRATTLAARRQLLAEVVDRARREAAMTEEG